MNTSFNKAEIINFTFIALDLIYFLLKISLIIVFAYIKANSFPKIIDLNQIKAEVRSK